LLRRGTPVAVATATGAGAAGAGAGAGAGGPGGRGRGGQRGLVQLLALGEDDRDVGADLDGRALLREDLAQHAGSGCRDLGVDLVGRDLEQRLVAVDLVADLLEPLRNRSLGDGLAHLRHHDLGLPWLGIIHTERREA
jgi:hypothetical protein